MLKKDRMETTVDSALTELNNGHRSLSKRLIITENLKKENILEGPYSRGSNYAKENTFNFEIGSNESNVWMTESTTPYTTYIWYNFERKVIITNFETITRNAYDSRVYPSNMILQESHDNIKWYDIESYQDLETEPKQAVMISYLAKEPKSYKMFRLKVDGVVGGQGHYYTALAELTFFGYND